MNARPPDEPFDLEAALRPKRLGDHAFTAFGSSAGEAVYGGLLMGQSLLAAADTTGPRTCHAMQASFVHRADPAQRIAYTVADLQTGRNFCVRRVAGHQGEREIFTASLSFRAPLAVTDHSLPRAITREVPHESTSHLWRKPPPPGLDVRWNPPGADGQETVWMRSERRLGISPTVHHAALLYASDYPILEAGAARHAKGWRTEGLRATSLNQTSWIHAELDFNRWHLFCIDSPAAAGGTALGRASCYDATGRLVATLMQEALLHVEP